MGTSVFSTLRRRDFFILFSQRAKKAQKCKKRLQAKKNKKGA